MRNCTPLLLLLILPWVFVGCVSVDERMGAYLGMHYSKVVAVWGAPQTETDDGEGGKLLTWRFESTHTTPATVRTTTTHNNNSNAHTHSNSHSHGHDSSHSHAHHAATQALHGHDQHSSSSYHGNTHVNAHGRQVSTTTYTPETTTTNTYTRSFYTDPDGYIYDYAWKGWHPGY